MANLIPSVNGSLIINSASILAKIKQNLFYLGQNGTWKTKKILTLNMVILRLNNTTMLLTWGVYLIVIYLVNPWLQKY